MLVIKGRKYPEFQVAKYVHSYQYGKITRAGKQYEHIKFSISPDVVWDDM